MTPSTVKLSPTSVPAQYGRYVSGACQKKIEGLLCRRIRLTSATVRVPSRCLLIVQHLTNMAKKCVVARAISSPRDSPRDPGLAEDLNGLDIQGTGRLTTRCTVPTLCARLRSETIASAPARWVALSGTAGNTMLRSGFNTACDFWPAACLLNNERAPHATSGVLQLRCKDRARRSNRCPPWSQPSGLGFSRPWAWARLAAVTMSNGVRARCAAQESRPCGTFENVFCHRLTVACA